MKVFIPVLSTLFIATAFTQEVPAPWQSALEAAQATGDTALIEAVQSRIEALYPAPTETVAEVAETTHEERVRWLGLRDRVSGELAAGATYATGNTQEQAYQINAKGVYTGDDWRHTLAVRADSKEENNTRTQERYRVTHDSRYNIDEGQFLFAEVDFLSDRYGTYSYRLSEALGYGRNLWRTDTINLSAHIGLGARQSELVDGTEDNAFLYRTGADFAWQLAPQLKFTQSADATFGGDASIYEAQSQLRNDLNDHLYLTLSLDYEHVTEVPVGTKNTDTTTSVLLGYRFGDN